MDLIALSRLGGRHLVTLHLLLDTRSVTRSAERLCTTPSTVSKTLNQLRELLGDQLLYRQGNQLLADARLPSASARRCAACWGSSTASPARKDLPLPTGRGS